MQGPGYEISRILASVVAPGMGEEVRRGLTASPKELPPKYFYDETGSQLFDQICDTPEYYLTRTEFDLLTAHSARIMHLCRPAHVLEFGSGTSRKTRLLLDAWTDVPQRTYWPFDVSEEMLGEVAVALGREYPDIHVHGLMGDYSLGLGNLPHLNGVTLGLFLGSTIGNFSRTESQHFLDQVAGWLFPGDFLLLGADLVKPVETIEAAYNDRAGITEAFNKNMLRVINRALDGNFEPDQFDHHAFFDTELERVEMHLVARSDQNVLLKEIGMKVRFDAGETLRTEISRKFRADRLAETLADSGLEEVTRFVSQDYPYALILARRV
ncbi:MAG: L-histidine N(alpha)-methyltransferase [Xanthomonadales bacterium]|nr:L-histidine N(alpha)-methyltransferase [Xanthomonadales bacterium]